MALPQVTPVICTNQQVYDYMGISTAAAAGNLLNGTTTRSAYITNLMGWTARLITSWLGRDYTNGQQQLFTSAGNGKTFWTFDFPIGAIELCKTWDPLNPSVAQIDDSGNVAILTNDIYKIIRTDGAYFNPFLWYIMNFTQALDPVEFGGWPQDIIQVQLEMIKVIYQESNNNDNINGLLAGWPVGVGTLTVTEMHRYLGNEIKFEDMTLRWKDRIRPHRRIAI